MGGLRGAELVDQPERHHAG
ncbi:hypothetical protein STIAU_4082, partial [Stigmatella aurantiaca DW4/3-1]